jgi:hypothetical protein
VTRGVTPGTWNESRKVMFQFSLTVLLRKVLRTRYSLRAMLLVLAVAPPTFGGAWIVCHWMLAVYSRSDDSLYSRSGVTYDCNGDADHPTVTSVMERLDRFRREALRRNGEASRDRRESVEE